MDFMELLKDQRLQHAKAQLHQDVFVLSELDFKKMATLLSLVQPTACKLAILGC